MLVIRNFREDKSTDRIDILGLSKDDFYLIEKGIKSLLNTQNNYNPIRINSLLKDLNDNIAFLPISENKLPMFSKLEINRDFVDLGLPSGLKWATCNVGATSPEQAGLYFAWGETKGYTAEQVEKEVHSFNTKTYTAFGISADLTLEQDAAHVNLGGNWRMPTKAEWEDLISNTDQIWTADYNGTGVAGRVFTSKVNGNSVFFPAAGEVSGEFIHRVGTDGCYYWSASLNSRYYAWCSYSYFGHYRVNGGLRYRGLPVRGVCE